MAYRKKRYRRRKHYKHNRREAALIRRILPSLMTKGSEVATFHTTQNNSAWIGQARANTLDISVGDAALLSSLPATVSAMGRPGQQIFFDRFYITVHVRPSGPVSPAYANVPPSRWRVVIFMAKMVPGPAAAHTWPQILDIFQTAAPNVVDADMYCPLNYIQSNAGKQANYKILRDHRFGMLVSGGGNDNSLTHHKKFTIRVPRYTRTTYDGDGNNIASSAQNHFFCIVYQDYTPAAAADRFDITINSRALYHY